MSVLVECYSVIVRRSEIEQRYPGGLARYERECPGRTFCADSHLVRVGFMTTRDLEMFLLRNLSRTDLASSPTGNGRDRRISCQSVAIVEQWRGRWHPRRPIGSSMPSGRTASAIPGSRERRLGICACPTDGFWGMTTPDRS